ncbi:glycosyltransferase [Xanthomonadaceae bacterium XH05]|nr:glycosyltransferase [Xanthomonadaceae bacterium XH05]
MPVFNEAAYLAMTLDCLLAQDYPNLEIVICDNASTDATPEICAHTADRDQRVRVLRAEANLGATANFQRCLDEANGDFFMWAGGHDLWSPNYVSQCVAALDAYPSAVIAVPESNWIDENGQVYGSRASVLDTRDMAPLARLLTLLWANMHPIYGLICVEKLRACGPLPNYQGADLVLLARLILAGDFVPAPMALWSRRQARVQENYRDRQRRYASSKVKIHGGRFPLLNLVYKLWHAVWSSPLPLSDKLAFTLALPGALPARYLIARRRVI